MHFQMLLLSLLLLPPLLLGSMAAANPDPSIRAERYVEFDPPRIFPESPSQTVKAGGSYSFRCEGSPRRGSGVSWRLPVDATDDLRSRVGLSHRAERRRGGTIHVSELRLRGLRYTDTGTFVCTYNGTGADTSSIDNSTRVHLFVEDPRHLLKLTGVDFFQFVQSTRAVLPCQPTHPAVNVSLFHGGREVDYRNERNINFDPRVGFVISPVTLEQHNGQFKCLASSATGETQQLILIVTVLAKTDFVPPPVIELQQGSSSGGGGGANGGGHVKVGDTFQLKCSVTLDIGVRVELSWTTPNSLALSGRRLAASDSIEQTRNFSMGATHLKVVERTLEIRDATKDDQGAYECRVTDHSGNTKSRSEFVRVADRDEPFLRLAPDAVDEEREVGTAWGREHGGADELRWVVQVEGDPRPTSVVWHDPRGRPIDTQADPRMRQDYSVRTVLDHPNMHTRLTIKRVGLETAGSYRLVVRTKLEQDGEEKEEGKKSRELRAEETLRLTVNSPAKARASMSESRRFYQLAENYEAKCVATGHPRPKINWLFKPCSSRLECDNKGTRALSPGAQTVVSAHRMESTLQHVATESGMLICQTCNGVGQSGCRYDQIPFFVSDVPDGFHVDGPRQAEERSQIKLKCSASKSDYANITWFKHDASRGDLQLVGGRSKGERERDGLGDFRIDYLSTKWSHTKQLSFPSVDLSNRGRYLCRVDVRPEAMPEVGAKGSASASALASSYSGYYNDDSRGASSSSSAGGGGGRHKRKTEEQSLDLRVLPLELPELSVTNLWDNLTVVEDPADGLTLVCRVAGRPRPTMEWVLNSRPLKPTVNTTRVAMVEEGQVLKISYLTEEYEGLYRCVATNKVGRASAVQTVRLRSTVEADERFATLSYPVVAAAIAALVLVILLLCLAKLFYANRRLKLRRKAGAAQHQGGAAVAVGASGVQRPPTPPHHRMRQYALPLPDRDEEDCGGSSSGLGGCSAADEDAECRVTLTSAAALNHGGGGGSGGSGSVSPFRYGGSGLDGGGNGSVAGSSLLSPPVMPMAHYCHCHFGGCASSAASQVGTLGRHGHHNHHVQAAASPFGTLPPPPPPNCSLFEYDSSAAPPTMPFNRFMTLGRYADSGRRPPTAMGGGSILDSNGGGATLATSTPQEQQQQQLNKGGANIKRSRSRSISPQPRLSAEF